MSFAGPLIIRPRSPYDPVVRSLVAQQAGADASWSLIKKMLTILVRRGRDVGWYDRLDAFYWYALPSLSGATIKVDLRNPTRSRTVSVGGYGHEGYAGLRFTDGGRIDSGLPFTDANAHTLLSYFNSNDDDDAAANVVSGARGPSHQIQFVPRNSLNRMTLRSGANLNLSNPSLSSLGLCGFSRIDSANVRVCLGGFPVDQPFDTDGVLPSGNCFFGAINSDGDTSQTFLRVADMMAAAQALTTDMMIDLHEAITDVLEEFDELATYTKPVALGDSWFRRDHIDEVLPAGSTVLIGPTGPPDNDQQSNISSYYGPGYSRFPLTHAQSRIIPAEAATWQQSEMGVLARMWEPRIKLENRKPNGVELPLVDDGTGKMVPVRVNGLPPFVDYDDAGENYDAYDWARGAGDALFMGLAGKSMAYIIDELQSRGLPITDDPDTPSSNIFTAAYLAVHAAEHFTDVRLAKAVANNIIYTPEGLMSDVPNGKCTIIRIDCENRDFLSPGRFLAKMRWRSDFCVENGIMFSLGLNALQASASTGVDASVMREILDLPGLWSSQIVATKSPPTTMAAWLDAELAFYGADPPKKILIAFPVGPFARLRDAGVELCRDINDWAQDHSDVIMGYSETPGNAAFGGDYDTWVNLCKERAYGILNPDDPGYPGDPTPPVTTDRDYDCRFGDLPPSLAVVRSSTGTTFDDSGQLLSIAANTHRIDHNPVTGEVLGLLIEQGTTNIVTFSDQFGAAFWTPNARAKIGVTNGHADPMDGTTSDKLAVATVTAGTHNLQTTTAVSMTSGNWYTQSVFVAKAETLFASLTIGNPVTTQRAIFDLTTGASTFDQGTPTVSVRQISDEPMYRIAQSFAATSTASSNGNIQLAQSFGGVGFNSYAGVVDDGYWIWGGQITSTDCVLMPILTAGATVTTGNENVDTGSTAILTDTAFYFEGYAAYGHGWKKQYLFSVFNGTTLVEAYRDTDTHIHFRTKVSGTVTCDIDLGATVDGGHFAMSGRYATTDFAAVLNAAGVVGAMQTSVGSNGGAAPSGLTTSHIGRDDTGSANYFNGRMAFFQHKASKTDAELLAAVTDFTGFALES